MRYGWVGSLLLLLGALAACDSGPKGTYSNVNGLVTLDVLGGGAIVEHLHQEAEHHATVRRVQLAQRILIPLAQALREATVVLASSSESRHRLQCASSGVVQRARTIS